MLRSSDSTPPTDGHARRVRKAMFKSIAGVELWPTRSHRAGSRGSHIWRAQFRRFGEAMRFAGSMRLRLNMAVHRVRVKRPIIGYPESWPRNCWRLSVLVQLSL
jgi:hypothetical protein